MGCLASRKDTTYRVKKRLPRLGNAAPLTKKEAFVIRTKHLFKSWTTPSPLALIGMGSTQKATPNKRPLTQPPHRDIPQDLVDIFSKGANHDE